MSKLQAGLNKLKRINREFVGFTAQLGHSVNAEKVEILVTPTKTEPVFDSAGIKVTHQIYQFMFEKEEFLSKGFSPTRGFILFFKDEIYQSVQGAKGVARDNAQLQGFITINFSKIAQ